MKRGRLTIFPLLLAVAFGLYQYFGAEKYTNPETGRQARVAMSPEQEEALGVQSYREVLGQSDTVRSGPEKELVERVAQRLARATGEAGEDFNWQVSVVRSPQANAFCLPGGKIVVYTGILEHTATEAGLAAVMGHEMAHAIARHGSQRLLRTNLAQTILMGAQFSLSDMEPQQRYAVMAALGAGASYGVLLPFGREHETEADQMGVLYMARAGYDPEEAIAFWERMERAGGSNTPEFASTHPSHGTRVRNLRAFMPEAKSAYANAAE